MTDLVNSYKIDVSTQSSEPSSNTSNTSNTLSEESVKDKRAHSPHNRFPTISPTVMLKKLEIANYEPESFIETIENDITKNLYVVSHEILSNISNTEEPDISDIIDPELQDMLKSHSPKKSRNTKNKLVLENVTLNIAITGMTGAGKSSFVNALRGLHNDDPRAAATGTTETTMTPQMYPHPCMPDVKIWDLPGTGSPKFKAKNYLNYVHFKMYERFRKNNIDLAKAIQKNKKCFCFIRSKIDNDVRAERHKRDFDELKLLNIIREDCKKNLQKVGKPKVFLISSFQLEKYDFQELVNTLEEELPKNKRFALIQSLPVYSSEALTKKKTYFKKMIWPNAFAAAFLPVPGVSLACDYGIIKNFFQQIFTGFGLSDVAMEALSERVNKPADLLKAAKTSRFKDGVSEAIVIDMISEPSFRHHCSAKDIAKAKILGTIISAFSGRVIPARGTVVASVHYLLNTGLNEMADDTRNVLVVSELMSN